MEHSPVEMELRQAKARIKELEERHEKIEVAVGRLLTYVARAPHKLDIIGWTLTTLLAIMTRTHTAIETLEYLSTPREYTSGEYRSIKPAPLLAILDATEDKEYELEFELRDATAESDKRVEIVKK